MKKIDLTQLKSKFHWGIFFAIFSLAMLLSSCSSSMTPIQVNNTLPTLTSTSLYNQSQGNEALKNNKCRLLVEERSYVAPIGLTVKDDLKNGAKGIDEWVQMDGGNAYILKNYKWVTVDHNGSTQLHVEFDTMQCE